VRERDAVLGGRELQRVVFVFESVSGINDHRHFVVSSRPSLGGSAAAVRTLRLPLRSSGTNAESSAVSIEDHYSWSFSVADDHEDSHCTPHTLEDEVCCIVASDCQ
jgi:hypothetical protein